MWLLPVDCSRCSGSRRHLDLRILCHHKSRKADCKHIGLVNRLDRYRTVSMSQPWNSMVILRVVSIYSVPTASAIERIISCICAFAAAHLLVGRTDAFRVHALLPALALFITDYFSVDTQLTSRALQCFRMNRSSRNRW